MTTIVLEDSNPKLIKALKTIIECFNINYKISNKHTEKANYSKRLLENIDIADKEREEGKLISLDTNNIWASI